jgi:hypothetical protein
LGFLFSWGHPENPELGYSHQVISEYFANKFVFSGSVTQYKTQRVRKRGCWGYGKEEESWGKIWFS